MSVVATSGAADAERQLQRLERATADLQPPFAVLDLDALWANAQSMERLAGGKPIRLASKSVRCRVLQAQLLGREGFVGTLAYTLPEALWLDSEGFQDVLVAYPTADSGALSELALITAERPEARVTVMVDCIAHVAAIEAAGASEQAPVRVCIDIDAGWWALGGRLKIGAKRSPVHTADQARALAQAIAARPAVKLVGLMAY
ncbi:MAG: alanine racemase, partial [Solirubrobacteraceae bacterium]